MNISAMAGAALSDGGMKWAREEAGMAGAFWAQLPGNFDFRVRVATSLAAISPGSAASTTTPLAAFAA
jgi:type IV secretory pathway VirB4 component